MPNNSQNVKSGKPMATGAVYVAPAGTAMPQDAAAALGAAFKCVGYISDGGLTVSTKRETSEIKAWGGDVVANPQNSYGREYKFSCIELNATVLELACGPDNVTVGNDGSITVLSNSKELPHIGLVIEIALDTETVERKCIANAKVSEIADISYNDNDPVAHEFTVKAYPDANGNYEVAYIAAVEGEGTQQTE